MLFQEVDLIEEGLTRKILDKLQPALTISAWTAARHDWDTAYKVQVSLLSGIPSLPVKSFKETCKVPRKGDISGVKISHTFNNYGQGVRFIRFSHGGDDRLFWPRHNDPKMTVLSITVDID